jgi:acylaminoacyl-peptidase
MHKPPARGRAAAALILLLLAGAALARGAEGPKAFSAMDVFRLEYADDPQVSPDGKRVVYVRTFFDVMKDRRRSNLWVVNTDGTGHEPLTTGTQGDGAPRWSPDGKRIVYVSDAGGSPQLYCRWLESGRTAQLTRLTSAPAGPSWSPDGKWIAFAMQVPEQSKPFIDMPAKPEGATWADPPKMIRKMNYRFDGRGYLRDEHFQLFIVPADGGAPRQLTEGPYDHVAPEGAWTPDGKALLFSANRHPDHDFVPIDTEVYEVTVADRHVRPLTDRRGPDASPAVSPDGRQIAYVGFDDRRQGYQVAHLYLADRDGKNSRELTGTFDHTIGSPRWSRDGKGVYFLYAEHGNTKVGFVSPEGEVKTVAHDVGGTSISRPYASGSYSVGEGGLVAFTQTTPTQPAELAVIGPGESQPRKLTSLNEGLLGDRALARAEEVWFQSSHDGRKIQGWVLKPPHFDAKKKYPMILEIHGGPFADYGDRFAAELQLYAAAGYVVFYCNPRGSTSYGEEFGNLIHHAYPGNDYDDLMSGVDEVLRKGYVDADHLYVTGGSGGGVLTCWIVGKTKRFRAAVSTYPVINWYSFVLTSDGSAFFTQYWFPGMPWDQADHYMKRSPLSLVGNVSTPTMIMTGEEDYRTPISEAEQYYKGLKLRKIDSALVRVPGAGHNISARPSHMIAKTAYILKWFETHK